MSRCMQIKQQTRRESIWNASLASFAFLSSSNQLTILALHQNSSLMEPKLNLNLHTNKLAQSIKLIIANMINLKQQTSTTDEQPNSDCEWPKSFIQLLESLASKQSMQSSSSPTIDYCRSCDSISPVSSLAIDDRDFELMALQLNFDQNQQQQSDNNSIWLMNFTLNDQHQNQNIIPIDLPESPLRLSSPELNVESITDENNNNLTNLINSVSAENVREPKRKLNSRNRRKTLPISFNQITIIDFDQTTTFKQDFDEQPQQEQLEQLDANKSIEAASSIQDDHCEVQQEPKDAGEDGKYSMLQFALYNFREAIEKYSLESRVSKSETCADTSTLRGSLKLIETLRNRSSELGSQTPTGVGNQSRNDRRKSSRVSSEWTWRELAEMVKFTASPIRQSLLQLPSEDLNKRALECFAAIMQYMGDLLQAKSHHQQVAQSSEFECVYLILMNCHNFPILRDEIYCQLMKQTTNNRSANPDSCLRGWRLFSMLAAYFDCSLSFRPYLLKYLETAAFDKRRAYCSIASICLQNLRKTFKYNGRKNVPSIEEIAATSAGRNSKRQIYRLPGGTERVINTKSTTVVEDIIQEICTSMLNVTDQDEMLEFSLYCIAQGDLYTMPLNRDEYILDITTELIKNQQQYFLIFCRSIWHYPLRLDSKLYIELIFNQIAPDYLEGLLLVLPGQLWKRSSIGSNQDSLAAPDGLRLKTKLVKEIARIAALLHRASATDYMPHKDEIKYLLPKPIIAAIKQYQRISRSSNANCSASSASSSNESSAREEQLSGRPIDTVITTPDKWVELVQSNWREMSAFDALDAKAQFLDIVRHWPLFGSSFFAIKFIQRDLIQPVEFILALNKFGIQMLDMSSHETIHKYPFNEVISTRKVRSEDGALFLDLKCGNLMKRTIIRIQTDQAHEISRLIKQYIDIELLQQQRLQQPRESSIRSAAD